MIGADPRLDPVRVLPALFRPLLPTRLKSALASHAANRSCGAAHHARFVAVRIVLDATSKGDAVHRLTAGLAYQGVALALAVRTWHQTLPSPKANTRPRSSVR